MEDDRSSEAGIGIGRTGAERGQLQTHMDDPLVLQSSDHPGASLVTSPLTGSNYLSWSRAIKIALGAKTKLGFINGKLEQPAENSATYEQWKKVDCMVISWILNSISKEIVDAFIYANSARELWVDLEQRFGESNGPLLYQLQREISSLNQGNMTVVVYYTKLKKLWDEYACLMPMPVCSCGCTCGVKKEMGEMNNFNKLIQFLMGLNDSFDHVRNQILVMDPLPTVNKAYSMILRVEKQRDVHQSYAEGHDTALMTKNQGHHGYGRGGNSMRGGSSRGYGRGKGRQSYEDKANLYCNHCNITGHTKDNCFKIHGYPDWYMKLKEQKGQMGQNRVVANMADNPLNLEENSTGLEDRTEIENMDISNIIQREIKKYMGGKTRPSGGMANFAYFDDFAGPTD